MQIIQLMNMNCVLCNDTVADCSKIEIYYTFTTHTKTLLINFIKKTLNCDLNKAHSKYICKECCNIFEELDFTESTYTALRKTIFQRWSLNECDSLTKDAMCQTDDNFISDDTHFKGVNTDILSLETIKQENNENVTTETIISHRRKDHMAKTGKQKKSHICQFCKKKFVTNSGMILHERRKHQNESHPSVVAGNSIHIEKSVKVECDVVIKELAKTEIDHGPDDDSSSTSSKSNGNIKKIKAKKKIGTVVKPLKYACPQCPKMWRTTGELRNHVASHSNLRPYICEVCGQAYKHKTALDIHVGMHNGINPFSCKYCQKSFTQKGALQRHLPIHTGEAPYQCDLCGKRFVHHTSFNMHTLAHTGQKSYKCSTCGLALLSGSHLKRHMRVHTGERPYACVQCGKRFAERYNLAAHQRLHEAGPSELSKRSYRCQVCGAGFDRRPKLEEHLSNNHNKISENDPSRKWVGHFLGNT